MGWVAIAGDLRPAGTVHGDPVGASGGEAPTKDDTALVARLDAFFARTGSHLDPDLSLARFAWRFGVSAERLSTAVNRVAGGNVSRHVNAWRMKTACERLEAGDSVTAAWLASGFAARSSFNWEFMRITDTAPSAHAVRGS